MITAPSNLFKAPNIPPKRFVKRFFSKTKFEEKNNNIAATY